MCGEIWVPRLTLGGEGDRDGVGQCDGGSQKNRNIGHSFSFPETHPWNGRSRGSGSLMRSRPEPPSRVLCSE